MTNDMTFEQLKALREAGYPAKPHHHDGIIVRIAAECPRCEVEQTARESFKIAAANNAVRLIEEERQHADRLAEALGTLKNYLHCTTDCVRPFDKDAVHSEGCDYGTMEKLLAEHEGRR